LHAGRRDSYSRDFFKRVRLDALRILPHTMLFLPVFRGGKRGWPPSVKEEPGGGTMELGGKGEGPEKEGKLGSLPSGVANV
jgi:hypothetical protein